VIEGDTETTPSSPQQPPPPSITEDDAPEPALVGIVLSDAVVRSQSLYNHKTDLIVLPTGRWQWLSRRHGLQPLCLRRSSQ
jgi:hypothetical protein